MVNKKVRTTIKKNVLFFRNRFILFVLKLPTTQLTLPFALNSISAITRTKYKHPNILQSGYNNVQFGVNTNLHL